MSYFFRNKSKNHYKSLSIFVILLFVGARGLGLGSTFLATETSKYYPSFFKQTPEKKLNLQLASFETEIGEEDQNEDDETQHFDRNLVGRQFQEHYRSPLNHQFYSYTFSHRKSAGKIYLLIRSLKLYC